MKVEDQVAPLALAQEMKALGFSQRSCFAWVYPDSPMIVHDPLAWLENEGATGAFLIHSPHEWSTAISCAAPTVAEMGEWLPDGATSWADGYSHCRQWTAAESLDDVGVVRSAATGATTEDCDTEAEARARLLIALAKAGAIDPRETASSSR